MAKTTYRRRLAKALATSGESPRERPAIWSPVESCLERLVTSGEAREEGLMQACERELLEVVTKRFPGSTGLGSALLGVTPPTYRRRLASLTRSAVGTRQPG